MYYRSFVIDNENSGVAYPNLPDDPERYYKQCLAEGLEYYGKRVLLGDKAAS
jgi:hypothetical protein